MNKMMASLILTILLGCVLATAVLAEVQLTAAQTGPSLSPPAQARRQLTDNEAAVIAIGALTLTIIPVILGIRAAKRKGISPHWMWFGLHPVGGWIAYLIIRSRPDRRAAAPVRPQPLPVTPPARPAAAPKPKVGLDVAQRAEQVTPPKPTAGLESSADVKTGKTPMTSDLVNRGDRQDTLQQAMAYWTARFSDPFPDPYVMYLFDNSPDAREALLELPCIHEGVDGKLICTEPLIFGYYRQANGQYEAVICGHSLTHELWERAKLSFEKHGGLRKNDLEPESPAPGAFAEPPAPRAESTDPSAGVVFIREERKPTKLGSGIATYRIHSGPNEASARSFLKVHPVADSFFYIVVETPEGNFGRDVEGIYEEPGSRPAPAKPSPAPASSPMSDHTMFKTLADLCYAYQQNDRAEIARLEPEATLIGQELNRRGGIRAMRAVWERLGNRPGARTLDMHWDGIGEWRG